MFGKRNLLYFFVAGDGYKNKKNKAFTSEEKSARVWRLESGTLNNVSSKNFKNKEIFLDNTLKEERIL